MNGKRKLLPIISTTLVLLICFFVGLYILGVNGEAYKYSLKFINDNEIISRNIGPIQSQRLAFLGYSVRHIGPHGHAEYKILVKGTKSRGVVYLELEKSAGLWKVVKGNLIRENGEIISIMYINEE